MPAKHCTLCKSKKGIQSGLKPHLSFFPDKSTTVWFCLKYSTHCCNYHLLPPPILASSRFSTSLVCFCFCQVAQDRINWDNLHTFRIYNILFHCLFILRDIFCKLKSNIWYRIISLFYTQTYKWALEVSWKIK